MPSFVRLSAVSLFLGLGLAAQAHAVVLASSEKKNSDPPTGAFAESGWQWQGQWGAVLGTAISKKYFITAGHVGGGVNQTFYFHGNAHRTVEVWGDPQSDLRIYKCVGLFSTWAPLFKDTTEAGRSATLFGRGRTRGEEVNVNGEVKGWKWGDEDGATSWGRNSIEGVLPWGPKGSDLLHFDFDGGAEGTSYEGALSQNDSGGGVFVKQGNTWKLAGINYSVDGPFSTNPDGSDSFPATIFDRGGLWMSGPGYVKDRSAPITTSFYATRISSRYQWIMDVFNGLIPPGIPDEGKPNVVPEPSAAVGLLAVSLLGLRRRSR